jgi:hypothetical protein
MVLIAKDTEASYNSQQSLLTGVDVAGFSKIFSTMWGGSLYGHFEASAVFMVLLSLCDRDGTIDMTPEAIAGHTGWPLDLIRTGIAELAAPDPRSRTKGHEGRRILPLDEHRDWGWRITNYQKYRDEMRSAERREYLRQAKEAERARKKSTLVNNVNNVNQCQPIAEAEAEADTIEPTALVASAAPKAPNCPSQEIVDLYHKHLPMLPRVEVLNDSRRRALSARWKDVINDQEINTAADSRQAAIEWFVWYFERVASSRFLTGKAKDWRADFDFLLSPMKFAKVVEGHYHKERV